MQQQQPTSVSFTLAGRLEYPKDPTDEELDEMCKDPVASTHALLRKKYGHGLAELDENGKYVFFPAFAKDVIKNKSPVQDGLLLPPAAYMKAHNDGKIFHFLNDEATRSLTQKTRDFNNMKAGKAALLQCDRIKLVKDSTKLLFSRAPCQAAKIVKDIAHEAGFESHHQEQMDFNSMRKGFVSRQQLYNAGNGQAFMDLDTGTSRMLGHRNEGTRARYYLDPVNTSLVIANRPPWENKKIRTNADMEDILSRGTAHSNRPERPEVEDIAADLSVLMCKEYPNLFRAKCLFRRDARGAAQGKHKTALTSFRLVVVSAFVNECISDGKAGTSVACDKWKFAAYLHLSTKGTDKQKCDAVVRLAYLNLISILNKCSTKSEYDKKFFDYVKSVVSVQGKTEKNLVDGLKLPEVAPRWLPVVTFSKTSWSKLCPPPVEDVPQAVTDYLKQPRVAKFLKESRVAAEKEKNKRPALQYDRKETDEMMKWFKKLGCKLGVKYVQGGINKIAKAIYTSDQLDGDKVLVNRTYTHVKSKISTCAFIPEAPPAETESAESPSTTSSSTSSSISTSISTITTSSAR